jgi:hypothetical protein
MAEEQTPVVLHAPQTLADVIQPKPPQAPVDKPPPVLSQPFQPLPHPTANQGDMKTGRALALAERMIANGHDRSRVEAALQADGVDPALLDNRSAAQRAHDNAHRVPDRSDRSALSFQLPSADVVPAEHQAEFGNDVREIVSELRLDGDRGNTFARLLVTATTRANAEPDLAAAHQRETAKLRNVYGAQYDDRVKAVNALLDEAGKGVANRKFVDALRPNGVIGGRADVFVALANRAASLNLWRSSRPKS